MDNALGVAPRATSVTRGLSRQHRIEELISQRVACSPHPFLAGITAGNVGLVARRYFAMSIGFPYAQAGSQSRLLDGMVARRAAPRDTIELTTVVANFLCWDETGGHSVILAQGNQGLPRILETGRNFHSNLLKHDLRRLFGQEVEPEFDVTGPYLLALRDALGDDDDVRRCAAMVAFERHAALMIASFWRRLTDLFGAELGAELGYFSTHVGGDDPAEAYHVSMTGGLVDRIVDDAELGRFMAAFEENFEMHMRWSASCCKPITLGAAS
jgi:hypothetical protein